MIGWLAVVCIIPHLTFSANQSVSDSTCTFYRSTVQRMNANNAKVKAVFLFLPTFLSLNNVEQTFSKVV